MKFWLELKGSLPPHRKAEHLAKSGDCLLEIAGMGLSKTTEAEEKQPGDQGVFQFSEGQ